MKWFIKLVLKFLLILIILIILFNYTEQQVKKSPILVGFLLRATQAKNAIISGLNSLVNLCKDKNSDLGVGGIACTVKDKTLTLEDFWLGFIAGIVFTLIIVWILKEKQK